MRQWGLARADHDFHLSDGCMPAPTVATRQQRGTPWTTSPHQEDEDNPCVRFNTLLPPQPHSLAVAAPSQCRCSHSTSASHWVRCWWNPRLPPSAWNRHSSVGQCRSVWASGSCTDVSRILDSLRITDPLLRVLGQVNVSAILYALQPGLLPAAAQLQQFWTVQPNDPLSWHCPGQERSAADSLRPTLPLPRGPTPLVHADPAVVVVGPVVPPGPGPGGCLLLNRSTSRAEEKTCHMGAGGSASAIRQGVHDSQAAKVYHVEVGDSGRRIIPPIDDLPTA